VSRTPPPPSPFVESFRVAAPYIHAHRGRTFVVLVGGEAVVERSFPRLVHDIGLLHGLGVRVVLVHGTRPQIERRLKERGAESRMEAGVRVTAPAHLDLVLQAAGEARSRFEAMLSMGSGPMAGARIAIVGGNFVTARPWGVRDGVDYGATGEVRRVDVEGLRQHLDGGALVLLSPIGYSPTGEVLNLHSHGLAAAVAEALEADKLIGLVEARGIVDSRRRLVSVMTPAEARRHLERKHLGADARRHLEAAAAAVEAGVRRAHIVDRRADGALLQELFTREGAGTLVTAQPYETLRPATLADVGPLSLLLEPLEEEGILVRRGRAKLEAEVDRFIVLERDGLVIGCAALEIFEDTAELYCVAIAPRYRRGGRGDALLSHMEERARAAGVGSLFVLTTRSAHFFQERGFAPGKPKELPTRRRASYDRGRKSKVLFKPLVEPR
jgi:amino-acid N-acetyltransferase